MKCLLPLVLFFSLTACVHRDLSSRHGSPLHTYNCADGKSFQSRQILTGEVEVTAGGRTRDVLDSDGNLPLLGPRLIPVDEATRLEGMPGGPYEACFMEE